MIGFLEGKVVVRDDPYVIINVGGVGYRVLAAREVLAGAVSSDGRSFKVFTYTHVRDDAIELFGFQAPEDLKLFKYLISVSGIGPKTAMNIFGAGNRNEIVLAITKGDVNFFTSVPRLGRKNAQKIIIELKNKFGSLEDLDLSENSEENSQIIAGLKSFGFSAKEAGDAVKAIKDRGETIEEKIKLALKYLGK